MTITIHTTTTNGHLKAAFYLHELSLSLFFFSCIYFPECRPRDGLSCWLKCLQVDIHLYHFLSLCLNAMQSRSNSAVSVSYRVYAATILSISSITNWLLRASLYSSASTSAPRESNPAPTLPGPSRGRPSRDLSNLLLRR